jgi:hypothetical protein
MDESGQNPVEAPSTLRYEGQATEKPTSVMVFGILNIVFGGMGLLCMPFNLFWLVLPNRMIVMVPAYRVILLVSSIVGIGFSAWLLSLGIGLLKMKSWGRRGSVIYSIIVIVWGIIGIILNILALHFGWMNVPEGGLPGYIGGMCGGAVGMIYPVLLLIFMQTSKVKGAFGTS